MKLAAGTRLGPYEIQSALGAGGMGEVYKARDHRLDRTVAIKVLPTEVAADPERRRRFEQESRAVAAISHPHICVVHDVGRDGEIDFLVMEHLEGETLAARLDRLKIPLPLDQAMRIGAEIADALDKAHRAGVVHRDLKPANVMLTTSGSKLLDFGLAKRDAPTEQTAASADTRTGPPKTAAGTILGTPHYMAPEQAEGRDADARSDIWALGVVLYEMTTGGRPFEGDSTASVIASILRDTPASMTSRQPLTPAGLDHIVERCLDKNPDARWQHAGDVRRELEWASRLRSAVGAVAPGKEPRGYWIWRWPATVGIALALLLAGVAAGVLGTRQRTATADTNQPPMRFEVLPPPEGTWSPAPTALTAQLAMSPDGTKLAFVATRAGEPSRIWIRPLDRVEAEFVPGTEGASFPFWSPDGRFIGFFATGKLKKVDIALGTPQALADVAAGRGGAWSPSGVIVFGQSSSPLSQVPADGGPVTAATTFDPVQDPAWHYWPRFLPDGRRFLFLQRSVKPEYQGIHVGSLDSPQTTRLMAADVGGLFASGRLLFLRDGLLFAQPLDLQSLQLTGQPTRVADAIGYYAAAFGHAAVDASADGVLALGPPLQMSRLLQSFSRDGHVAGPARQAPLQGPFQGLRLAPDGQTLAVSVRESGQNADVWTIDLVRGLRTRVTTFPDNDWSPAWMPDGRRLLFASTRAPTSAGANAVYKITVGARGSEEPLNAKASIRGYPADISADGQFLLFHNLTQRGYDLGGVSLASDEAPLDFLSTPFNEVQPRFSPDRRWVAYASDDSGRFEVYLRAWPSAADRIPVSLAGGMQPEWRSDGKELFYLSTDRKIMAVPIALARPVPVTGNPRALFSVDVSEPVAPYHNDYAVTADGQFFVVAQDSRLSIPQTLTVLFNWTAATRD